MKFCRYYLHFEVRKGIRYIKSIAIDDFSLSPQCFGLNIPASELDGYDYWNPNINGLETDNNTIADFDNVKRKPQTGYRGCLPSETFPKLQIILRFK